MFEQLSFGNIEPTLTETESELLKEYAKLDTVSKTYIINVIKYIHKQETEKETIHKELTKICEEISKENDLKSSPFEISKSIRNSEEVASHIDAVSVTIASAFSLRISLRKKTPYRIEYNKQLDEYITLPDSFTKGEQKSLPDILYFDAEELSELTYTVCKAILQQALEHYEPSEFFGCCGKYEQCSNSRKCLHEDLFYSKACYYRKNLESGRIFYGENRNIE